MTDEKEKRNMTVELAHKLMMGRMDEKFAEVKEDFYTTSKLDYKTDGKDTPIVFAAGILQEATRGMMRAHSNAIVSAQAEQTYDMLMDFVFMLSMVMLNEAVQQLLVHNPQWDDRHLFEEQWRMARRAAAETCKMPSELTAMHKVEEGETAQELAALFRARAEGGTQ